MVEVLHALKAPLMIPMHYFSAYTLDGSCSGFGRNGTSKSRIFHRWWHRRAISRQAKVLVSARPLASAALTELIR
jgi:hypothetical protein